MKQDIREKIALIGRLKSETTIKSLCRKLPKCFRNYFEYVAKLGYTQKPNYKILKRYFRTTLLKVSKGRCQFDWHRAAFARNSKIQKIKDIAKTIRKQLSLKKNKSSRDVCKLLDPIKKPTRKPKKSTKKGVRFLKISANELGIGNSPA